ncbi:MAG TPA: biopolymer transporter ExbD [Cyclobacteriaceae bacterium]|nr:biopolymer transporter ExbD [Cyclobacteriaceae bacterium]
MGKFKKKANVSQEIPTSSLPDVIFMLLFFFMVTTVIRESDILVQQRIPQARELNKLERKSLVSYVYVGKPKKADMGTESRLQLNDVLAEPKDIRLFVEQEKSKLQEAERDQITIAMKVDREVKMGIIVDIQQELKEVNARKVLYSTTKKIEM